MLIPKDKQKFPLWAKPETLQSVKEIYQSDNCRSQSEFIEKAILFYIGYLTADRPKSYLPNMFLSTMKSIVRESNNRMGRLLFKLAVEISMLLNVAASMWDIDKSELARLRGNCIEEVKRINGTISFDDAVDWQQGDDDPGT